jgi:uncharacterized protein (DUF58 family)
MRTLIRGLRARVERRTRAWLRRRQGPDHDPVELHRRRIYILPTRLGIAYAAMVFAMVIGGLNYNNNLGLGLAFLLVSLGLVAMHHCHGTLSGLALRLHSTRSAFAGQDVSFGLLLENQSRAARPRIEVGVDGDPTSVVDVPPAGSVPAGIAIRAERRGRVPLTRFVLATRHPLGLFRAWAVVHPEYAAIAWPRPADRSLPPPSVETDTGGAQDGARGEEDFAGLKPYQAGDSLRRIAWKAYARGQGLHTKQYAGTDVVSHVFDWDSLAGLDVETRLAQLCRWVVDAHEHGEAFGLRLPGLAIEPNLGTAHLEHCLNALALHEPGAARG